MWRTACVSLRIVVTLAVAGLLLTVSGADVKPDRKKSRTAYQTGLRADEAGNRDEAIAAYTEAIQADISNGAAWRNRGNDYLAVGDKAKAGVDLDHRESVLGELDVVLGETVERLKAVRLGLQHRQDLFDGGTVGR